MSAVRWIEEPGLLAGPPSVPDEKRVGVGEAAWLGQTAQQNGKLSTIEKIGIASVVIGGASLALNLWHLFQKASSQ